MTKQREAALTIGGACVLLGCVIAGDYYHRTHDIWVGREINCFFPAKSVSVVRNPSGIGKFKFGDTCEMGNEWRERVVAKVDSTWYISVITKNEGGECPPGTAVMARDSGLRMLNERWVNRDKEREIEANYGKSADAAKAYLISHPEVFQVSNHR